MPHKRKYTRRVNSNGEDVMPTICSTFYKGVQRQLDNGGGYVLDYFIRTKKETIHTPLISEQHL